MTGEAARALATVDVFLVADKGPAKADLVAAREAVCDALIPPDHAYRVVEVTDPPRGPDAERDTAAYGRGVREWHEARVAAYADVIDGLDERETTVGFLVWGTRPFTTRRSGSWTPSWNAGQRAAWLSTMTSSLASAPPVARRTTPNSVEPHRCSGAHHDRPPPPRRVRPRAG